MSTKKRLIFCTYSSVYSSIVLEHLLKSHDIEIVAIVNSTRLFKPDYGHFQGAIKQIRTTGWRYATYLFLVTGGFSLLQPFVKLQDNPLKTIHKMAKKKNIPLHDTKDINNQTSLDFIAYQSASILVAAHFNQLIKDNILEQSALECLNIHPSLLPAYKGVDPVFYAMANQPSEFGVTLHRMADTFDSGEILLQQSSSINLNNSLFTNNCKLFEKGAKSIIDYLITQKSDDKSNNRVEHFRQKNDKLAKNKGKSISLRQTQDKPSPPSRTASIREAQDKDYDSWPTKEKVNQFKQLGKNLINLKDLWRVSSQNGGSIKNG